jgi:hypothetical protein
MTPPEDFKAASHRICSQVCRVPSNERQKFLDDEIAKLPEDQREIARTWVTTQVEISEEHVAQNRMKTAMPIFKLIVLVTTLISLACVGTGAFAIHRGATSNTKFDFLGAHLSTGSVGVALVGIGLLIGFFTIKAVLKKL